MPTEAQVLEALKQIEDPDLGRDIVSLGFIKNLKICDGAVSFDIELTTPACPVKEDFKHRARSYVGRIPDVTAVNVNMTAQTRGRPTVNTDILRGVKNVVAIASGKGGVGKSTATVNLALALAGTGARVGILDADVYGPSIPAMLGISGGPELNAEGQAIPPLGFGIKVMSVGMLVSDDEAAIWRGPIVSRILQQFLSAVEWGELDYLLLDLPPGTGDVQLTLTQSAPLNGAVIVTTPQDVALRIARKGLRMFQKVNVPVLGIIENMAGFVCPNCKTVHHIFRKGGGARTALETGVPMLGSIPLDERMVESGDLGKPLIVLDPESPGAKAFASVAKNMAAQLSIANIKSKDAQNRPLEMHLHDQTPPRIVWDDGTALTYSAFELRVACPCAACKNEMTGERMLKPSDVPADIRVVETRPVGRYGQTLVFSDGHSTGIYSNQMLRTMGK